MFVNAQLERSANIQASVTCELVAPTFLAMSMSSSTTFRLRAKFSSENRGWYKMRTSSGSKSALERNLNRYVSA